MKCPKCGFHSFDHLTVCKKCQASLKEARAQLGLAETTPSAAALEAAMGAAAATGAAVVAPEPVQALPGQPAIAEAEPEFQLDPSVLEQEAGGEAEPSAETVEIEAAEPVAETVTLTEALTLEPEAASESEPMAEPEPVAEMEAAAEVSGEEAAAPSLEEAPREEEAQTLEAAEPEAAVAQEAPGPEEKAADPALDELPPELAALMAEAEAAVEEDEEVAPEAAATPVAELELDEELQKFLEQEGTSLEELASEEDDDDRQPPPPAATGGGGEGAFKFDGGDGGSEMRSQAEPPRRAGFWLRGLALGVDAALLCVLLLSLVASCVAAFLWGAQRLGPAADPLALLRLALVMTPLAVGLSIPLLTLSYFSCFHGLAGRTPGKMLVGLEVRSVEGGRLGCGRAFLRTVGYMISALPLALGFIWAGGRERLAWHDLLAGSEVLTL